MKCLEACVNKFSEFEQKEFFTVPLSPDKLPKFSNNTKSWLFWLTNAFGVIFVITLMYGGTFFGLVFMRPIMFPEHDSFFFYVAAFFVGQITTNLAMFHIFSKRNRVSYWVTKSSYMFNMDEQALLYGNQTPRIGAGVDESVVITVPETQRLIMDERSSDSLKCPPAPIPRLDFRDPILGAYYTEEGELIPPVVDTSKTKFCDECDCITPRRSHHCPVCQICVLRRDHHCFFAGGCIGLGNHRYFIVFIFYASVGAAVAGYLAGAYLNKYDTPLFPWGILKYLGPSVVIRWLLGYETLYTAITSTLFTASVSVTLGAGGFFIASMFYTLNGYTMHDYHTGRLKHMIECDGENYAERLALVFGKRWYLNFIFPQFWNPNILTPAIARNILLAGSKDL